MDRVSSSQQETGPKSYFEAKLKWFGLLLGTYLVTGLILFRWTHLGFRQRSLTETVIMSLGFAAGIAYGTPSIRRCSK
jgi:hypothetical protein